jgi:hypothetical protein
MNFLLPEDDDSDDDLMRLSTISSMSSMHFYADYIFWVHLGLDHHCSACVFGVEVWGLRDKKKTYSAICGFVV